ncbi:high affinity cAMP-specific and IBMX-insensitive 3',5'-cyclic phosphodiesterase 8-like isoform X2 [Stomoxys calcitrans]|uniref:high affinity cAMP-specific and IBMX-insensitive 3',5'-cyclic phosphodiesterase 8-like isoform X2 n=1 Tax=Stomoxys calcitrans TaxID=35570 RepID=UPI0027E23A8D|nr:high affinity cAMP-specific and IBMX-insensitive 3',5'-cyclic phosphodiesterase 8-like isoform X2 [Stomoxys calcitrans]
MGCSPSSLTRTADGLGSAEMGAAAGTVATTNEKDGSIFFCIKLKRARLRRCSQQNGGDGSGGSGSGSGSGGTNVDDLCNQALLNPLQIKNEENYEKCKVPVNASAPKHPPNGSYSLAMAI